jgi:hypothetical protein
MNLTETVSQFLLSLKPYLPLKVGDYTLQMKFMDSPGDQGEYVLTEMIQKTQRPRVIDMYAVEGASKLAAIASHLKEEAQKKRQQELDVLNKLNKALTPL